MASTLGTLAVNIISRTDGLVKGMKKGRKELKGFERFTAGATKRIKGHFVALGTSVAAIFTVGAFASAMKSAAADLDNLAKTSAKLGVLPEQLAGLRHAAQQTGVPVATMDMALQRFTRRVAEAARGTGEAKGALEELGVNSQLLVTLPLSEQMGIIADQMKGVGTQADRVRIAMKLFDSEGVALVNTLKSGSEGLRQMQMEANRLGATFSSKELRRVEELNDSIANLRKQFSSQMGQLLIDITPQAMESIRVLRTVMGATLQGGGFVSDRESRETDRMNSQTRNNPIVQDMLRRDRQHRDRRRASIQSGLAGFGMGAMAGAGQMSAAQMGTRVGIGTMGLGMLGTMGTHSKEREYRERIRQNRIELLQGRIAQREAQRARGSGGNNILERGSQEAFKALRANLRQDSDKQLDTMKRQLKQLEDQNGHLERLAEQLDFEVVG